MRTVRSIIAIAICSVTIVATTSVASAGIFVPTTGVLEVSCNDLGVYDVTLTVTSNDNGDVTLSEPFFEADDANGDEVASGDLPPFQPTMLLQTGATALLVFQVPGTTYDLYVEWRSGPQSIQDAELNGLEPCTPETTTTTAPPETSTTEAPDAPVAAAAVASPRFTG